MKLKDKIVLITGASSGFGADAAHLFAREGAKVILAARRLERLQKLAGEIQDQGGEALAIPVDVANGKDIEMMVQTTLDIYGRVDILFNNAGFGRLASFTKLNYERDIHTQIAVNLTGLIQVTHALLPHMIARGEGHIINMASIASLTAPPSYSVYAATKFGVRGFTDALRREVRHLGVRVSGIYPGPAATEFGKKPDDGSSSSGGFPMPDWVEMTSEYVAEQVIKVAKRPRRQLVLPRWFSFIIWLYNHLPRTADWVLGGLAKKSYSKNR